MNSWWRCLFALAGVRGVVSHGPRPLCCFPMSAKVIGKKKLPCKNKVYITHLISGWICCHHERRLLKQVEGSPLKCNWLFTKRLNIKLSSNKGQRVTPSVTNCTNRQQLDYFLPFCYCSVVWVSTALHKNIITSPTQDRVKIPIIICEKWQFSTISPFPAGQTLFLQSTLLAKSCCSQKSDPTSFVPAPTSALYISVY